MNDLQTTPDFDALVAEKRALSGEARLADVLARFDLMRDQVLHLAACVYVMDEEGESLEEIRGKYGSKLIDRLRLVAHGKMDPVAFRRWQFERPSILDAIRGLPTPDQQLLGNGGKVEVLTADGQTLLMAPDHDGFPLAQVFAADHIRTPAEQRVWQERERLRKARKPAPVTASGLRPDPERDGATIGRYFIPREDMRAVLRVLEK